MGVYKEGKNWKVQVYYKDWQGNQKRKQKRGFRTKGEAKEWERDFLQQQSQGVDIEFGNFLEIYYKDMDVRLREHTMYTKRYIIDLKIRPYFGKKILSEITVADVRAWQNELLMYKDSPIYNSKIDFDYLKQQIIANGPIQAYFTNRSGQYAMFQMVGLFFIGLFLIYIVWSDLYIIAILNVTMEKKGQKFWRLLLKWTCGKSKEGGKHIKSGIILIAISIIMTIGILPYILFLIQQSSQMS